MSDAFCIASCTRPRPSQPTLYTNWLRINPVESVTQRPRDACCLTPFDTRCSVLSTSIIVRVQFWSPPLARYSKLYIARTILHWIHCKCI